MMQQPRIVVIRNALEYAGIETQVRTEHGIDTLFLFSEDEKSLVAMVFEEDGVKIEIRQRPPRASFPGVIR